MPISELKFYVMSNSDWTITNVLTSIPAYEEGKSVLSIIDHKLQKIAYFNPMATNVNVNADGSSIVDGIVNNVLFTSGLRTFTEKYDPSKSYDASDNVFISCVDCFITPNTSNMYIHTDNLGNQTVDSNYVERYLAVQSKSGDKYLIAENLIRYTDSMLFTNDKVESNALSTSGDGIRYMYGINNNTNARNILAYKYKTSPSTSDRVKVDKAGYANKNFTNITLTKIESFDADTSTKTTFPSLLGQDLTGIVSGSTPAITCNSYYPNKSETGVYSKTETMDYYMIKAPFETQPSKKFILNNSSFRYNKYGLEGRWWLFDAIISNNMNKVKEMKMNVNVDETNVKLTIPQTNTVNKTVTLVIPTVSIGNISLTNTSSNNYSLKFIDDTKADNTYSINGRKGDAVISNEIKYYTMHTFHNF